MDETKEFLKKIGIKETFDEFKSYKRFNDGGQYRFEVPGIQSPRTMDALLQESLKKDVFIHRVTQTKGIMLLSDDEILKMVDLAKDYGCELFLSVGPRATYDTQPLSIPKRVAGLVTGSEAMIIWFMRLKM